MTYKAVAKRAPRTQDEFLMGKTRVIRQRNGVVSTVTMATRDDGITQRQVHIFANGACAARIAGHVLEGMTSRLEGKYSQTNVFVAMDVARG